MGTARRSIKQKALKAALDALVEGYDFAGRVSEDPISFPGRYNKKADVEVAGFIAALLAYGRVTLFMPVVEKILGQMGKSPAGYLRRFDHKEALLALKGVSYRFQSTRDIVALLLVMAELIKRHGSIEAAFMAHRGEADANIKTGLTGLVAEARDVDTTAVYGSGEKPRGFLQLFPSPSGGSACKRLNLFMRWMVRREEMDFGIWTGVTPSELVIPLDTHIARVSRCIGLSTRKSPDWKMAVEITDSLKKLDPLDPLRYDFALCHRGITGVCGGTGCEECDLI